MAGTGTRAGWAYSFGWTPEREPSHRAGRRPNPVATRRDPRGRHTHAHQYSVLESGTVFNHKPEEGWFSLDIRSMDARVIEAIEADVEQILATVESETTIDLTMEPFQLTPGGQIPGAERSALVVNAADISRHLGYEPSLGTSGSSNMNVPVAGGTLAIGTGGSRGGERGQPGEWADIDGMIRTAKHVFLLAISLGGGG